MDDSDVRAWSRMTALTVRTLGLRVALARRRRLWTEADVASRARVSRSTLSKIENGKGGVGLAAVVEVCWVLGVPILGASGLAEAEALLQDAELQLAGLSARVRAKPGPVPGDDF